MPRRWSSILPVVEFALYNAVHTSTGFTNFYVSGLTHPRVPETLFQGVTGLCGRGVDLLDIVSPTFVKKNR